MNWWVLWILLKGPNGKGAKQPFVAWLWNLFLNWTTDPLNIHIILLKNDDMSLHLKCNSTKSAQIKECPHKSCNVCVYFAFWFSQSCLHDLYLSTHKPWFMLTFLQIGSRIDVAQIAHWSRSASLTEILYYPCSSVSIHQTNLNLKIQWKSESMMMSLKHFNIIKDLIFSPFWKRRPKIARQLFFTPPYFGHWWSNQMRVRCWSQDLVFGRDPLWRSDQGSD